MIICNNINEISKIYSLKSPSWVSALCCSQLNKRWVGIMYMFFSPPKPLNQFWKDFCNSILFPSLPQKKEIIILYLFWRIWPKVRSLETVKNFAQSKCTYALVPIYIISCPIGYHISYTCKRNKEFNTTKIFRMNGKGFTLIGFNIRNANRDT